MKITLTIEVDISEHFDFDDKKEIDWFEKEVLKINNLHFHSNEIGDGIGKIINIKKIIYGRQQRTKTKRLQQT